MSEFLLKALTVVVVVGIGSAINNALNPKPDYSKLEVSKTDIQRMVERGESSKIPMTLPGINSFENK